MVNAQKQSWLRFGSMIFFAVLAVVLVQSPAFGFGWGIVLPPLPPLPNDIKDDPPPVINEEPSIDPVDPIEIVNVGEDPPPAGPGINDTPEPATIIAGLVGAGALGIAGWWKKRRRQR
jgi:hypothetical protein